MKTSGELLPIMEPFGFTEAEMTDQEGDGDLPEHQLAACRAGRAPDRVRPGLPV